MSEKALKVIAGAPDRPLRIGDIEIPCYVLEDEARVLSQRGLQSAIGLSVSGGAAIARTGARRMARFVVSLSAKGIDIKDLMARITSPNSSRQEAALLMAILRHYWLKFAMWCWLPAMQRYCSLNKCILPSVATY